MNSKFCFLCIFSLALGFNLTISEIHAQCVESDWKDCYQMGISDFVVRHNGKQLNLSQIGGINNLQIYDFSNGISRQFLLFDRDGNKVNFVGWEDGDFKLFWHGKSGDFYSDMPNWIVDPPPFYNWVVVAPGLCNGDKVVLSSSCGDRVRLIKVHPVNAVGYDHLSIVSDTLRYLDGKQKKDLIINSIDLPGVVDVDADGDLDILTFDPQGASLQWYRNESGECGKFQLVLADSCWGDFIETGLSKQVLTDTCAPDSLTDTAGGLRRGRTILPFDFDGNDRIDLALGNSNFNSINLLYNGGTFQNAHITSQDTAYPSSGMPVNIPQFPAAFILDADRDGDPDLLAAPASVKNSLDVDNLWFYENVDTMGGMQLRLRSKDFLQNEMLDWGRNSGVSILDDRYLVVSIASSKGVDGEEPGRLMLYEYDNWGEGLVIILVDSNYGNIDRYGFYDICVTFNDLNNDNTPDMVLGNEEGELYYAYLDGSTSPPSIPNIQPFSPRIDVGRNACPSLGHVDSDNLVDILVGERNGNLNYFQNHGTPDSPSFNAIPEDDSFGNIDTRAAGDCCGYSAPSFFYNYCPGNVTYFLLGDNNGHVQGYSIYNWGQITVEKNTILDGWSLIGYCVDAGSISRPACWGIPGIVMIGNSRGGVEVYFSDVLEGIEANQGHFSLQIYPNPATEQITLELPEEMTYELDIYSMDGRLLRSRSVERSRQSTLSLQGLPPGLYLLFLKSEHGYAAKKFVKE